MRILLQHRERPGEISGVLTHLTAISEELATQQIESHMFCSKDSGLFGRFSAIARHDVIVLNSNDLLSALTAKVLGKGLMLSLHFMFFNEPLKGKSVRFRYRAWVEIARPLERALLRLRKPLYRRRYNLVSVCRFLGRLATAVLADRITACSRALAEATPLPWPIEIIHPLHPVDLGIKGKKIENLADPPLICFVGRIEEAKGLDILLTAASQVWSKGLNFQLEVIGDGSSYDDSRQMAAKLGIDRITTFHGRMRHADVKQVVQRSLACVVPTRRFESFGLVAVEAADLGTCPIVAETGGLAEACGPAALSFPVENHIALAQRLIHAIENPQDMVDRGALCRNFAQEQFDPKRITKKYLKIAHDIMNGKRSRNGKVTTASAKSHVGK